MGFKRYGTEQIGGWVDANVEQAERLHELADRAPATSCRRRGRRCRPSACATRPRVSTTSARSPGCTRGRAPRSRSGEVLVLDDGAQGPRAGFRVNPVNFRTRREHIDELFATLVRECDAAAAETVRR